MFYVYPDAALQIPSVFATNGERAYRWVEIPLQVCYFLATLAVDVDDEMTLSRRILLANAQDVIDITESGGMGSKLERIDLLSPGYLRGEDCYRMDKIVEIWRDKHAGSSFNFKLESGATIFDPMADDDLSESDWELVMSLKSQTDCP